MPRDDGPVRRALVAGTGYLLAGLVDGALLLSLLAGSIPAVLLGSLLTHRIPARAVQILLALALVGSGVKTLR